MKLIPLIITNKSVEFDLDSFQLDTLDTVEISINNEITSNGSSRCSFIRVMTIINGRIQVFRIQLSLGLNAGTSSNSNCFYDIAWLKLKDMEDEREKEFYYGDDMFMDVMANLIHCVLFPNKHMPKTWVQKVAQEFIKIYESDESIYTRQPVQR